MYRNRGLARSHRQGEARKTMERYARGAAVALNVRATVGLTHWLYDLRRGRLCFYGGILRYIDLAIAQGKSKAEVKQSTAWLDWYIDEQFGPTNTGELRLVA